MQFSPRLTVSTYIHDSNTPLQDLFFHGMHRLELVCLRERG